MGFGELKVFFIDEPRCSMYDMFSIQLHFDDALRLITIYSVTYSPLCLGTLS
jgi:hypothetical protein